MDRIQERISYLQGLAEGLDLFQNKKEGKFLQELIDVITELNENLQHTTNRLTELEEYVEAIDDDLNDLEVDYYDEPDFDVIDEEDTETHDEEEDDDIQYFEVECPSCHELIMVDQDLFEDEGPTNVVCPNCEHVFILNDEESMANT
ncbi:CD1247 N-terminal domain-containing protein [Tepidibacillus sp. LV47]|uniref:CD1247 N-terminal domain-containing protein n=1 Tax=Tepidibacillus sp. LV47 TaxID=3398228 RepID=UPI003AAC05B3